MNLNDVFDRAYENAMRQGYVIDSDVLRACIDAIANAQPPYTPEHLEHVFMYIKENSELLPARVEEVRPWKRKWDQFLAAQDAWKRKLHAAPETQDPPPMLCDFGL